MITKRLTIKQQYGLSSSYINLDYINNLLRIFKAYYMDWLSYKLTIKMIRNLKYYSPYDTGLSDISLRHFSSNTVIFFFPGKSIESCMMP